MFIIHNVTVFEGSTRHKRIMSTYSLITCYDYYIQNKQRPLHHASKSGHQETVRELLEKGVDPNSLDKVSYHDYYVCIISLVYWVHPTMSGQH